MQESYFCPECGRPHAPKLAVSGPVRQRIVNIIANRPDGITRDQLMLAVYGNDPNGGPENPNVISVLVNHANRELRPQGYEISARPGRGALYRLRSIRPIRERKRHYRRANSFVYVF